MVVMSVGGGGEEEAKRIVGVKRIVTRPPVRAQRGIDLVLVVVLLVVAKVLVR
jgi:hypothetical protein